MNRTFYQGFVKSFEESQLEKKKHDESLSTNIVQSIPKQNASNEKAKQSQPEQELVKSILSKSVEKETRAAPAARSTRPISSTSTHKRTTQTKSETKTTIPKSSNVDKKAIMKTPQSKSVTKKLNKSVAESYQSSALHELSFEYPRGNAPIIIEFNAKSHLEQSFGMDSQTATEVTNQNFFQASDSKSQNTTNLFFTENDDSQVDQIETKIRKCIVQPTYLLKNFFYFI